jgi:hypothetical protein
MASPAILRVFLDGEELSIPLKQGSNVIGKNGGSADVRLHAASLSRRHALITVGEKAGDCTVEDLGSTNLSSVVVPGGQMQQMDTGRVYPLPHASTLVPLLTPPHFPPPHPGSALLAAVAAGVRNVAHRLDEAYHQVMGDVHATFSFSGASVPPPSSGGGEGGQVRLLLISVVLGPPTTLETTQGQINGFVSQLPSKCYLPKVASVGD